jgi:DMSO/TMAO reductase YedYZ heme-binding membrane subunit
MAPGAQKRRFLIAHKRPLKVIGISLAVAALAAPMLVVGLSPGGFSNASFSALRVLGLMAFTLIFLSILTGAMRPEFYMVYNHSRVYRFHIATGALGFCLALAHGVIVLVTKHYVGHPAVWIVGPVALGLLVVTIWAALDKRRLAVIWRAIHQINYLIFVAIFIKAVMIGSDVVTVDITSEIMKSLMILYVVLAAGALAVRMRDYRKMSARRRSRREVDDGKARTEQETDQGLPGPL